MAPKTEKELRILEAKAFVAAGIGTPFCKQRIARNDAGAKLKERICIEGNCVSYFPAQDAAEA